MWGKQGEPPETGRAAEAREVGVKTRSFREEWTEEQSGIRRGCGRLLEVAAPEGWRAAGSAPAAGGWRGREGEGERGAIPTGMAVGGGRGGMGAG